MLHTMAHSRRILGLAAVVLAFAASASAILVPAEIRNSARLECHSDKTLHKTNVGTSCAIQGTVKGVGVVVDPPPVP